MLIIHILVSCLATHAFAQQDTTDPFENKLNKAARMEDTKHLLDFTFNLYRAIAEDRPKENMVLSPISIGMALGMTLGGAADTSAKQIAEILGFKHTEEEAHVHETFGSLLKSIQEQSDEKTSLYLANYIFPDKKFSVLSSFYGLLKEHYDTTVETLNFQKPKETSNVINTHISEATRGKVKNMIQPDDITPLTCLILVNAIYFKSFWEAQFDPKFTKTDLFFIDNVSSAPCAMMFREAKYNFGMSEELGCHALELPYINKNVSMIILLPDEVEGLAQVEQKLSSNTLNALLSDMHMRKVRVSIPKFKLEEHTSLKPVLEKLGIRDIFDPNTANLAKLSSASGLYVSAVEHKAVIEVNEEGTEAAAVTVVRVLKRSLEIIEEFRADRPFMFLLVEKKQNVVLFLGSYKKPPSDSAQSHKDVHEEL